MELTFYCIKRFVEILVEDSREFFEEFDEVHDGKFDKN
jgi:hypothetical protein